VHFLIRKAAHFTDYAVFALLAARVLGSSREALRSHWLLAALLLITLYSLSDEFHQSFVPTRTASIYDSMIDTAGGFVALVFFPCGAHRATRKRSAKDSERKL
jgi:VanZ family protein